MDDASATEAVALTGAASGPSPEPFQHGVARHTPVIALPREVRHPASIADMHDMGA